VIQNPLKIRLAEGLIVVLAHNLYDFSGLQQIPAFGGMACSWTRALNLGVMRWEYEDVRDLGGATVLGTGKGCYGREGGMVGGDGDDGGLVVG